MSRWPKRIRLICLLSLIAVLLIGVGVAYGRYSSILQETLSFQAAQNDPTRAIEIHSEDGWLVTADRADFTFSLRNAGDVSGQSATLRLTATEGLDPSRVTVTLTVDGTAFHGRAQTIEPGTPLYERMGAGTEYRFYEGSEELAWAVSDGVSYTLTVEGASDASLLRLTATEA